MCNKSKAANHTNQIGSMMKALNKAKKEKHVASFDTIDL
jgi:hypothetical protein